MGQADQDYQDEDGHLGQRRQAEVSAADHGGPGKQEYRVNREDDVQEGIEEVTDVGLSPALADWVNTTLVGGELHGSGRTGSEYQAGAHRCNEEERACQNDSSNSQIWGHAGQPNQWARRRFRRAWAWAYRRCGRESHLPSTQASRLQTPPVDDPGGR